MIVINNQHDATTKQKIVDAQKSTAKTAENWANNAIKYPNRVCQLKGNLENIEITDDFVSLRPICHHRRRHSYYKFTVMQNTYITGHVK